VLVVVVWSVVGRRSQKVLVVSSRKGDRRPYALTVLVVMGSRACRPVAGRVERNSQERDG
jgi:hypothetical protein